MIDAQNLVKWYGPTLAVDDVSFGIPRGQIVGFLGPNGAGKSTTLRMLTGYLPPTSGGVVIDGHDALTQPVEVRSKIGYLPENTPLYPEMRVEEYLHYRGRLQKMSRLDRVRRIDTVCDRCGLVGVRRRQIGQLSRGNRQRVGLAQALLHEPSVLILDEPTAGLDPNQITHVRQLIRELRDHHTILLSTHILPEIEKTADQLLIIARGRIVAQGSPDELRRHVGSGSRVLLEVRAPADAVAGALEPLKNVESLETAMRDGWCQAVATPFGDGDPREAIGQVVLSNQWPIREMGYETASLERYYLEVTAQQDQSERGRVA